MISLLLLLYYLIVTYEFEGRDEGETGSEVKQRRRNFGRRSKAIGVRRCLRHANIQTSTRRSRRGEGGGRGGWCRFRRCKRRGGGGAGDCSPRLKSREPLLNGELARISRAWIYSKMPSLSSSKLCPFRPFLLKGRVSNGNSSPIVCVTLSPDEIDIVYNKYERKGKETGTIVRFVDNFWREKNKCWGKLCHLIVSDNWWKGDLIRIWKTLYRALKDKRNKFL